MHTEWANDVPREDLKALINNNQSNSNNNNNKLYWAKDSPNSVDEKHFAEDQANVIQREECLTTASRNTNISKTKKNILKPIRQTENKLLLDKT